MGAGPLKKGAMTPLSWKKGFPAKKIIPKCTDQVFLRYRFGKYRENANQIPTKNTKSLYNSSRIGSVYVFPATPKRPNRFVLRISWNNIDRSDS
jgi:hypothetical protein